MKSKITILVALAFSLFSKAFAQSAFSLQYSFPGRYSDPPIMCYHTQPFLLVNNDSETVVGTQDRALNYLGPNDDDVATCVATTNSVPQAGGTLKVFVPFHLKAYFKTTAGSAPVALNPSMISSVYNQYFFNQNTAPPEIATFWTTGTIKFWVVGDSVGNNASVWAGYYSNSPSLALTTNGASYTSTDQWNLLKNFSGPIDYNLANVTQTTANSSSFIYSNSTLAALGNASAFPYQSNRWWKINPSGPILTYASPLEDLTHSLAWNNASINYNGYSNDPTAIGYGGALITSNHLLTSYHVTVEGWHLMVGKEVRFTDGNGNVISRTLVKKAGYPDFDLAVFQLSSAIPFQQINPVSKVLPSDWRDFFPAPSLPSGAAYPNLPSIPALIVNRFKQIRVKDLGVSSAPTSTGYDFGSGQSYVSLKTPSIYSSVFDVQNSNFGANNFGSRRFYLDDGLEAGDSGHPAYLRLFNYTYGYLLYGFAWFGGFTPLYSHVSDEPKASSAAEGAKASGMELVNASIARIALDDAGYPTARFRGRFKIPAGLIESIPNTGSFSSFPNPNDPLVAGDFYLVRGIGTYSYPGGGWLSEGRILYWNGSGFVPMSLPGRLDALDLSTVGPRLRRSPFTYRSIW